SRARPPPPWREEGCRPARRRDSGASSVSRGRSRATSMAPAPRSRRRSCRRRSRTALPGSDTWLSSRSTRARRCSREFRPAPATFREMLAATFGGEVGQLTADAIRRMQEGKEEECLAALDRAETLLGTIPEEGIAPKRRQELERRLWWGYTKLGIRRVDGGMWEEALEPLLRALNFQGVGADRQEETRGPLIRALDAIVDARSPLIQRLTDEGDRDGALRTCDQ